MHRLFTFGRPLGRGRAAARAAADEPSQVASSASAAGCESHAPGHLMHYIHQGQALRSASVRAESVLVDGTRLEIVLADGTELTWYHHDPGRVGEVLGLFPSSRVVHPGFHALRVGPYWFNCATTPLAECAAPGTGGAGGAQPAGAEAVTRVSGAGPALPPR